MNVGLIAVLTATLFTFLLQSMPWLPASAAPPQTGAHQHQPVALDLSSTQANVKLGNFASQQPVSVKVGDTIKTFSAGAMVTPAERVAAYQVFSTGHQSIVLGTQGNAVGGSLNLGPRASQYIGSLTIPAGVTLFDNAARTSSINLTGNLVNGGTIYVLSSDPSQRTAALTAQNIFNLAGGTITSILPAGVYPGLLNSAKTIDLNLNALKDIVNAGSILSSGTLSLAAGGSITNASSAAGAQSRPVISGAMGTQLFAGSGTIVNSGVISSALGNIDLATLTGKDLIVNNASGLVQAQLGAINVRASSYAGKALTALLGGNFEAGSINLNGGAGTVKVDVDLLNGLTNVVANCASVVVNKGSLNFGNLAITGDPTFAATGDISLSDLGLKDLSLNGQDLAVLAGGSINLGSLQTIDLSCTNGCGGRGGDLTLLAGVDFSPQPSSQGEGVSADTATTFTINGPSASGGNFFTNGTFNVYTNSDSGRGGNVRIVAFSTVSQGGDLSGGIVGFNGTTNINTSSTAAGANAGDVQIMGAHLSIGGNGVPTTITANGGPADGNGGPQGNAGNIALQGFVPAVAAGTTVTNGTLSNTTNGQTTNGNTQNWSPFYPLHPWPSNFPDESSSESVNIWAPFTLNANGASGTGSFYVDTSGQITVTLSSSGSFIGNDFSATTTGPVTFGHPSSTDPIIKIPGVAAPFLGPVTPGHPFSLDIPIPSLISINDQQAAGRFTIDAASVTMTAGDIEVYRDRPIGRDFNITAENGDIIVKALTNNGGGRIKIAEELIGGGGSGSGGGGCGGFGAAAAAADPCGAVNLIVRGGNILYFSQGGTVMVTNPNSPPVFDVYSALSSSVKVQIGTNPDGSPIYKSFGIRGGGIEMWAGTWDPANPNHISFTTSNFAVSSDPNAQPGTGTFVVEQVGGETVNFPSLSTTNSNGRVFLHAGPAPDPIDLSGVGTFTVQAFPQPPVDIPPPCADCGGTPPVVLAQPPPPVRVDLPQFQSSIILSIDQTNLYATPPIKVPNVCRPTQIVATRETMDELQTKQWFVASSACQPFSMDMDGDTLVIGSAGTTFAPDGATGITLKEGRMVVLASSGGSNIKTALGNVKVAASGSVIVDEKAAGVLRVINLAGGNAQVEIASGDKTKTLSCSPGQEMLVADQSVAEEELIDANGVDRQPIEGAVAVAGLKTQINKFDSRSMSEKEPLLVCNRGCLTPREKRRLKEIQSSMAGSVHKLTPVALRHNAIQPLAEPSHYSPLAAFSDFSAHVPGAPTSKQLVYGVNRARELVQGDDSLPDSNLSPVSYVSPATSGGVRTLNAAGCSVRTIGDGEILLGDDGLVNIKHGQALVSASAQTGVICGDSRVVLDAGTVALITNKNGTARVDNLYDYHDGGLHVALGGKKVDISAGQEILIGHDDSLLSRILKSDGLTRRRVKRFDMNHELSFFRSEVSYVSIFMNSDLLSGLMRSNYAEDKDLLARLLKMAACITTITSGHGVYLPMGS